MGNGIVSRSAAASLRQRSGMGLPVGKHIVPDKPLPVNDELMWDNGTAFPEPCIDRIADTVGKYEALAWLCGGLGFFASLGLLAVWNDKASKIPFRGHWKLIPFDFEVAGNIHLKSNEVQVFGINSSFPLLPSQYNAEIVRMGENARSTDAISFFFPLLQSQR
ncbi:UNVERIFIED_CONTAM: NADH dehydrogenase [ubiquinone] 1 beta subcomplex subunit, mitochondrial [Sesamum calycinum]|uniref:NADH dehydrogenase [ubiquinone] 1 beta subcomplex subunit, mitochondrial n=1 Tax=Sesamum calycinum TaxID=2727403 RepID=A0AAW2QZY7_9LAMI